ncbi:MAG: N-acetylmuramoyl-L-alanine amidase [Lysinibacillus sp.]
MQYKKFAMLLFFSVMSMFIVHNTASANVQFTDIPKSHGAYEEINFLVNKNVISGYTVNGKKMFKPNNYVTRGQAAKMLVLATNNTGLKVSTSSFDDIKTTQQVSQYAERVYSKAWFQHTSGRNFSPNMIVSRQEMAKIVSKAYNLNIDKYADADLPFKDVPKSSMYYKYIAAVYYNGIAKGSTSTEFNMNKGVTRSQFALFVSRASSEKYRLDLPVQGAEKALGQVEVTTDSLNVRSSANFSSSTNRVGTVTKGTILKYYEVGSNFYKIAFNGEFAYISKTYAKIVADDKPATSTPAPTPTPKPEPEEPTVNTSTTAIVTAAELNVRAQANGSSTRVGIVKRGAKLPVQSIAGNWLKVTYQGKTAYIHKMYVRLKNNSGSPVKGRIIVLDAGHGGKDSGAVGSDGSKEKDVVLSVTKKVQALLEAKGAVVYLTRSGDTYPELTDRVSYSKSKNAEMFISIHANSATNTSANGAETFYSKSNSVNYLEDQLLAKYINDEMVKNADMRDRGDKVGDFLVIREQSIPAVLVELGFISNSADRAKLTSAKYQNIFAESIYNGIVKYYSR